MFQVIIGGVAFRYFLFASKKTKNILVVFKLFFVASEIVRRVKQFHFCLKLFLPIEYTVLYLLTFYFQS